MDATRRMLALLNENFPDITALPPLEARAAVDARVRPASNLDDVADATDEAVEVDGGKRRLRVYTPHDPDRRAPAIVYVHGGGFLHGSIESHDGFCRRLARASRCVVASIENRLAPEAGPPEPVRDVVGAVDAVVTRGRAEHGVILAGDSSGATLAALATIALRDPGDSPVVGQVLVYPFLDPRAASESYARLATGYFVTRASLGYYWATYLGERDLDDAARDPEVTPLAVAELAGLPAAIVVTAGLDPLSTLGASPRPRSPSSPATMPASSTAS